MHVPAGNKACPLCGWTAIEFVKTEGKRRALSCLRCRLGWTYPPCDPENYEAGFFGKDNDKNANRRARMVIADLPKQYQKMYAIQEQICTRMTPPGGRMLDVGCADGVLIERLAARGFRCKGIEPSYEASSLAREAGLDVVQGYFPHAEAAGPFDLVIVSHVFEHVPDPDAFLREVTAVAPGGYVVFTQCNYRGIIPRTFRHWYGWCLGGHFWHLPASALRRILQEAGFAVQFIRQSSMAHLSRRHKYFLNIIDLFPGMSDQYMLVAKIPGASAKTITAA